MKKRLIFVNVILVSISIVVLFLFSVSLIMADNSETTENQINNYMSLVTNYYDGMNEEETISYFSSSINDFRITIFDADFNIIIDTLVDVDSGDYRPELDDLGTVYTRYSNNLDRNMVYMATKDDGNFIRISMEVSQINSFISTYFEVGVGLLIVIIILSAVAAIHLAERTLKPISNVVAKLAVIGETTVKLDKYDEYELSKQIDAINYQIGSKLIEIEKEKQKINDIIESTKESIVVVNSQGNIELINQNALDLFKLLKENAIDQSYFVLLQSNEVIKLITQSLNDKVFAKSVINIDSSFYEVNLIEVKKLWIEGVLITLNDITLDYNLGKIKREFFQNASHELKSPLTAIVGYQQLIQEGIYSTKEEILDGVTDTIREAKRMNNIIIDMLDISRLESNIQHEIVELNIKDVINEVYKSLGPQILRKDIKVSMDVVDKIIEVNNYHIFELIKNILENAIKYNINGGKINIKLTDLSLTIEDTGIGIEETNVDRIFERFYRVNNSKDSVDGGTGLGLSIVKHVCNLYDYNIQVISTFGVGTTFIITF